jgi:transcriptional regulator with XRE-family HTH domain
MAQRCRITHGAISRLASGKRRTPSLVIAFALERLYGIGAETWLEDHGRYEGAARHHETRQGAGVDAEERRSKETTMPSGDKPSETVTYPQIIKQAERGMTELTGGAGGTGPAVERTREEVRKLDERHAERRRNYGKNG